MNMFQKNPVYRISLVTLTIVLMLLASCGKGSGGHSDMPVTLKVGVIIPETGPLAFLGAPTRDAIILAHEHIEEELAQEGLSIDLVWGDSQGDPSKGVTILQKMASMDHVNAVMCNLSGVTKATYPAASNARLFFVGLTVEPSYFQQGDNAVRVYYSFRKEGELLAQEIRTKGWAKVLILHSADAATKYEIEQVLLPDLEGTGVEITRDEFQVGDKGLRDIVTKHAQGSFDGLVLHGFGIDLPRLMETVQDFPNLANLPKLGSLGCIDIAADRRPLMAGVEFFAPAFLVGAENDSYSEVKAEFERRFPKHEFNYNAVYSYDAFIVLSRAFLEARSSSPDSLRSAMSAPMKALTQAYRFDESGDCAPEVRKAVFVPDGNIQQAAS
jgi:branched-chain amino acid transport system substrate-binding protein